jgi:hypothetical protein
VNRINATHADNQSGAPWADAQAITVSQGGRVGLSNSADASTLYYTSAGTKILRYDLDGSVNFRILPPC